MSRNLYEEKAIDFYEGYKLIKCLEEKWIKPRYFYADWKVCEQAFEQIRCIFSKEKDIVNVIDQMSFEFGTAKFVLIFDNLDFVIKIPFNAYLNDEDKLTNFINGSGKVNDNYLAKEQDLYQLAKRKGLHRFFAELHDFGTHMFYLQEKVSFLDPDEDTIKNFNQDWLDVCRVCYGKEATDRFLKFCKENYLYDDMHESNYGYNGNLQPQIIDWVDCIENC